MTTTSQLGLGKPLRRKVSRALCSRTASSAVSCTDDNRHASVRTGASPWFAHVDAIMDFALQRPRVNADSFLRTRRVPACKSWKISQSEDWDWKKPSCYCGHGLHQQSLAKLQLSVMHGRTLHVCPRNTTQAADGLRQLTPTLRPDNVEELDLRAVLSSPLLKEVYMNNVGAL